ncbi:hypothetical protein [Streptomyces lushanensis]|uniref:hypothetical protein n=1 Tax=Streptomyces lushanensis TaxID=1434255 RepID=UPI00114D0ED7|nr:hypothetical protein [Streptomyces lushanensis]
MRARAYDEQVTGEGRPERIRRGAAAVRGGEPHTSPYAALIALQRTAGNTAVVRLLASGRGAVVQKVPERGHVERRAGRRQAANNSPYSGRPQSARQQAQQGFDPAEARPRTLPGQGPNGERIWSGTRRDIGFDANTVDTVLGATPSQLANGRTEYRCAKCATFIPRKSDSTPADGDRHVTIDHISEIIAYVQSKAAELSWAVNGHPVRAITRDEAKTWANDPANLRVLCAQPCNGGKRAARSASRRYDTNKAVWWAT